MAQDMCVVMNAEDRVRLDAISSDRSQPHKHVLRARIIVHYADRLLVQGWRDGPVLDGTVFGRCMQRHRHQEFLRFIAAIERQIPAGKIIHVVAR